ncbi:chlorophyllase [Streptomyces sp. CRN 30]|uniref:alpha/beta hydrolase family protein n=1 Tax=Streptomyces sp. CRN 30 TaxID=3075613 RepID=UPI002A83AEAA|nr:chlorophyllase [Streptomyces sp. CRN 30]
MPASPSAPIVSVRPVVLPAPGRGDDLQLRVSAPVTGHDLPVVLFSHGYGQSMDGYAPLADHWAAQGFVVVQPTHLDSRRLGLPADDPRTPGIWRVRVEDLKRSLDGLDALTAAVPGLAGRVDHGRIAVAGHSWGAQTASMLLGARVLGADGTPGEDLSDPRVTAGVLLALTGLGGADLSPFAAENFPFMSPSFATMTTPALLVAGDKDDSPLSVRGPDWFTDGFTHSPGDKALLTLFGAEHSLGGITGHESTETTDESPERVALLRRLTTAWLRTALGADAAAWPTERAAPQAGPHPLGEVRSK